MKNLILGIGLGSLFTSGLGIGASLYDQKGNVRAPSGSQQQMDYFRQRGAWMDLQALRQQSDRLAAERQRSAGVPCAK
jgi:hypothetical protein